MRSDARGEALGPGAAPAQLPCAGLGPSRVGSYSNSHPSCGQNNSGYGGLATRPDIGAALPTRLADEARLEIGEPDLVRPLVDNIAAQDDVVAGIVQTEDDETTNTGRAHLSQRDLHRAAIR